MRTLFFLIGLFCSSVVYSQIKDIYGEIHVELFIYKKDTVRFAKPKVIAINKAGATDIIPLGKIKNQEFGIKVEVLISRVGIAESFIVGKAFFIKENNSWKELFKTDHSEREYNVGRPVQIPNESQGLSSGEGDGERGFELASWEIYYVNG